MNICEYGCGKEGLFQVTKNNKWCCSTHYNKCEANRRKNSEGVKNIHKSGYYKQFNNCGFTDAHRQATIDQRKDEVVRDLMTDGNSTYRSNHYIKKIIKERNLLPQRCAECGIDSWREKEITLELDHIDGNYYNGRLDNLRLLCPNCHSQTETFRGRNVNDGKTKVSDDELLESIRTSKNIRRALINVGLSPRGANYARAHSLIKSH